MGNLGTTELVIILAVVVLLFGVGRISRIGGELGGAVKAFREGLAGDDDPQESEAKSE
jgi:sec-independent protein translocase protein TatA